MMATGIGNTIHQPIPERKNALAGFRHSAASFAATFARIRARSARDCRNG